MEDLPSQITIAADKTERIQGGMLLTGSRITLELPGIPARYLYSGWQSWSFTSWVSISHHFRTMRPAIMHPSETDPAHVHDRRPNGSWYGAVDQPGGGILFIGALGLDTHVALDGSNLVGWVEIGQIPPVPAEWFVASGDEREIFTRYAGLLAERLGKGRAPKPYKVWCSWYSLYTGIHETQLLKILGDLEDLPFDVFQVDDGWQAGIGDWEANAKFPSGMQFLADRIKATGRKAGLWLAPFLVVPSSRIYQEHRDWLLRDEKEKLVPAGCNWGERLYTLDATHPDAQVWLADLMKKVRSWGYDYVKLDFLYAGALPGKHHADMPREVAYRCGLEVIRQALGDAYFLTCGAPILPSIGLCDAMRIGPDVAAQFSSHRDDDLLMNFAAPGLRNALRTSLHRLWLAPLLHTDPDVVYFRTLQNGLNEEQKVLLQHLAMVCNYKATSDIPAWLTDIERNALRIFLQTTPVVRIIGAMAYRVGDADVDFSPFISLPSVPGPLTNLQGAVLGHLANIPLALDIFDRLGKRSLKKMLANNPV
jgi:alpha-galactosidase